MTNKRNHRRTRLIRLSDSFFDILGLRPIGIAVFATSTILFFYLIGLSSGAVRAEGVAVAGRVDHPAPVSSFVTRTFVKAGDRVEVGSPLVELSSIFIDQDLERLDLQISQLSATREFELARNAMGGRSPTTIGGGVATNSIELDELRQAHFDKQLDSKLIRRDQLLADREALIVKSNFAGIVSQIAWLGATVSERSSVASVMPEFAEEIVAYVAPDVDASAIASGVETFIVGASSEACRSPGVIRSRGAEVEKAPGQLREMLGNPVHGMPVHITIPRDCRLVNGQVLALNFRNEVN